MPRAKTPAATIGVVKFAAILAFFRTQPMEIAKFGQELVNDAVKERENKGKAVLAGRNKGADSQAAVDAATASALAPEGAAGAVPAKKKPGPQKGYKKGASGGAQAGGAATAAAPVAEVTDAAALPPQGGATEAVLDLDAPAQK